MVADSRISDTLAGIPTSSAASLTIFSVNPWNWVSCPPPNKDSITFDLVFFDISVIMFFPLYPIGSLLGNSNYCKVSPEVLLSS